MTGWPGMMASPGSAEQRYDAVRRRTNSQFGGTGGDHRDRRLGVRDFRVGDCQLLAGRPQMRGLICFFCRGELCARGADGSGSLVEILARGETVRGELGFSAELLFGIEQIGTRRFDLAFEDRDLLGADPGIDPIACSSRLARLRLRQH